MNDETEKQHFTDSAFSDVAKRRGTVAAAKQ